MKNSSHLLIIMLIILRINNYAQDAGWEIIPSGINENLNSIYFYNHQTGIVCGDSGVIIKTVDSGKTWQSISSPVNVNLNDCFMFSEECIALVGDSASWIGTNDDGTIWFVNHILDIVNEIYSMSFAPREQFFYDGIYGADSQKIMFGVSNYCSSVIVDVYGGSSGGFWSAFMLTDKIGFVAGENSISQPIVGRTTNSGSSWDYVYFYLDGNEGRGTGVNFTDSVIGYISAVVWDGRGAIAKTTDNGDNWTTSFFDNPLHSINFPISNAGQIGYCVGDSGTILKTFNAGDSWHNQLSNTSERLNKVFFLDNDYGFAVGDNGIILKTTNGGGVTSITEDEILGVLHFELLQNYPNPFNPSTKISWQSPVGSWQTLKIYDLLGNEIATLVDEYKNAGSYEIEFDGTGLSSSVYIYQLIVENYIQTRKMLLLR